MFTTSENGLISVATITFAATILFMQHQFEYEKNKTIQALRYHFLSRFEIKALMIFVNIFAIVAAFLFYNKKIRPEPFLLGTCIWILMMVIVWYILPFSIYKKAATFKQKFIIHFQSAQINLSNETGEVNWPYGAFVKWFETPHFFHLYFDSKSFFLVPKEGMSEEGKHEVRGILKKAIKD